MFPFIVCRLPTLRPQEDLTKETLQKQFKIVKSHTNTSHVQQFGNKVMGETAPSVSPLYPLPPSFNSRAEFLCFCLRRPYLT